MWESRVLCGISKRGGNGGKVGVGLFHGSRGASFPQPSPGFWAIWLECRPWAQLEVQFLIFRTRDRCTFFQILAESPILREGPTSLILRPFGACVDANTQVPTVVMHSWNALDPAELNSCYPVWAAFLRAGIED